MRRADPTRRLLAVLTAEAEVIRHADFTQLEQLALEKTRLSDLLLRSRPGPGAAPLERLRRQAERNATLLRAAQQGLRDAQARIEALAKGPAGLRTYDAAGAAQPTSADKAPSLERRA
jgi:hypothetical protein